LPSEAHKGNLGEWSELYTLGYLLLNGGAYAADENQVAIPDQFHKVLSIYLASNKNSPEIEYTIEEDSIDIMSGTEIIASLDRDDVRRSLGIMLKELKDGTRKGTFSLPAGNHLLTLLSKQRISASSAEQENDLEIVLEDPSTKASSPRVGFSIKSQLGGRSTLLNASPATNFIYKVVPNIDDIRKPYPDFVHGKHRKNLISLYEAGFHLEFKKIANDTFYKNLTLLDMQFPNYLARILLNSYLNQEDSFSENAFMVFPANNEASRQPIFKLKEFLGAVAMGLRPASTWDGDTTKFRGILVVKNNGEVLVYYLYNRKNFEEHLFSNLAFERPSTTRHKYGSIYSQDGEDLIKLNLQIRFISKRGIDGN
jgi:type II restriction enzyme